MTGRVLDETGPGIAGTLHAMVRRLGEPVIRASVSAAIKQMGRQFVLGETIQAAMERSRQIRSEALADMGASFWPRMFGGAPKATRQPGKMADC